MTNFRFLGWLMLFSLFPKGIWAQVESADFKSVSKEEAVALTKNCHFAGQDADYYVDESSLTEWRIYVDVDPMKGWQQDSYIATMPKSVRKDMSVMPGLQKNVRLQGNFVPFLIKNRYGNNANSKPRVAKSTFANGGNPVASRTYAVILSGGIDKYRNYERYWNDCSFIYQTLVNKYGIPKGNIYPIMSDGNNPAADMNLTTGGFASQSLDLDFDGGADISLAATKTNVGKTLATLSQKLQKDDHLFFFVIDHGSFDVDNSSSFICLWNEERLYDRELASMLKPFTSKLVNVNVVLGQCNAGGFNDNLEMVGCVVSSAAQEKESSWACPDIPYDEFVYQWTCAVNGATHTGVRVNADVDNNGRVTMEEAFNYALNHDRQIDKETPIYTSTPLSVGEDLAFNHLAPSIDLYIPDNFEDTGKEPNMTTQNYWKSPMICVRNLDDSIFVHQNPEYYAGHDVAYVYVKVWNRGKETYTGGKYLQLYWAKASTGLTPEVWRAREVDDNGKITGAPMEITPINGIISSGDFSMVRVRWLLPSMLEEIPEGNFHFCILAKILDQPEDDRYVPGETKFNILGSNKQAQKNVTIIRKKDLSKGAYVFVRNTSSTTKAYTLELVPEASSDATFYSVGKVEMELGSKVNVAWERGGSLSQELEFPAYNSSTGALRTVKFVSPKSQLKGVCLSGGEFGEVRLKFKFNEFFVSNSPYTFDLIQRDENGNVIGGETFVVEPPSFTVDPIGTTSIPISNCLYQLKADTTGYSYFEWVDVNGETLGELSSIVVNPKVTGNNYTIMAMTKEGDIATGHIALEDENGIKSVSVPTAKSLEVTLKAPAPAAATVALTSAIDGTSKVSCPIPEGTDNVTLDVSNLSSGVYVVSYSVNSELVDQKKVKIE